MEVLSISSFCEIFVADYDDVSYYFLVFDIISNFVFLSEELAIIYLVGINSYVRRPYNLFQLAISLVIIGLLITSIITWLKIYIRIMQALVFFRVMRIMKIILKTDHLKFFFMTFYKFLPNFFDCLGVLCMIFYFFIALGIILFSNIKVNIYLAVKLIHLQYPTYKPKIFQRVLSTIISMISIMDLCLLLSFWL